MNGRFKGLWLIVAFVLISCETADAGIFFNRGKNKRERETCTETNCPTHGSQFNAKGGFTGEVPQEFFDSYLGQQSPNVSTLNLGALKIVEADPDARVDAALLEAIQLKRYSDNAEAKLEATILARDRAAAKARTVARQEYELAKKELANRREDVERLESAALVEGPPEETTIVAP